MKIGILTFHSQLNYGGVLQCWALQTALEKMGHEVVVIDRWREKNNRWLRGNFWDLPFKKKLSYLRYAYRVKNGELGTFIRRLRTMMFIRSKLHLTSYSFCDWHDAPLKLGVDIILVGSDQVWRIGPWDDPTPYLLDFRDDIPKFSYAASFGMPKIPDESLDLYKKALKKFSAVSCREYNGVQICKMLGVLSTQVCDPTLLLNSSDYGVSDGCENMLLCYFLAQDPIPVLPLLESFALRNSCKVILLTIETQRIQQTLLDRVVFASFAGPSEFLRYISKARWVVTDSFHGLMFSTIFKRNVRILRPNDAIRLAMFARIEEFVNLYIRGNVICDDVYSALQSLNSDSQLQYEQEAIEKKRQTSFKWLGDNIK